jgi:magnesium-transporting ATPase (P-type)
MANYLDLSSIQGLSDDEARQRLQAEGYNELPSSQKRSVIAIAINVVREPMFLLLVACGTLYLILGDIQEAVMLLGFVVVVMGITLYQERKTERALEALRDLSSPRASVIRYRGHCGASRGGPRSCRRDSDVLHQPFRRRIIVDRRVCCGAENRRRRAERIYAAGR